MKESEKYEKIAFKCFVLAKESCNKPELRKSLVKLGLFFRGMQHMEENDEYMQAHK